MPDDVRRLRITKCEAKHTFQNKFGNDSTLHDVEALNEDGAHIPGPLRSFEMLTVGEVIEVSIERYEHPKYGVSYTLKPTKKQTGGGNAALAGEVRELRGRVESLEEFRRWAMERFKLLGVKPPEEEPAAPPTPSNTGQAFGDDPPF